MIDTARSFQLYQRLAANARALGFQVPASHNSLFQPTAANLNYCTSLYEKQHMAERCSRRPGDHTCQYCERFHLSNLKRINKGADLALSDHLEDCFCRTLQQELTGMGLKVRCEKFATDDGHLPDFVVRRESDKMPIAYYELKAIFRPFLKIAERVNPAYECYANSLTLDLSNGKKLWEQRSRVENRLGVDSVLYVYWYDLPCIKGVFWMPARSVYLEMDKQVPYDRRKTSGDYNQGFKIGSTKKLYLPLLKMGDYSTLLRFFEAKYKG